MVGSGRVLRRGFEASESGVCLQVKQTRFSNGIYLEVKKIGGFWVNCDAGEAD